MINGKKKGKNGELEVVRLCRAQGYEARRSAQYCGNNEEGTADVVGLPGIHIEVKRVEHLNLDDALAQASRDAGKTTGNIPAVFHRKNGTGWKVTMGADDWFRLYREWEAGLVEERGEQRSDEYGRISYRCTAGTSTGDDICITD